MKSREEILEEVIEQGARIVFAQHILSGNRDDKVRDFLTEQKYNDKLFGLQCINAELISENKKLQNQVSNLEYCQKIQDVRFKVLREELASYKEKYETALKAIEQLEKIINKEHYASVKRCCK